jgi:O-antigen/teichoic acid export membrane protein
MSQLTRSVSTLVGGTAFAQVLSILALPFLTRLYAPAEFSILAIYASMLGILCVVAGLRLEIAVPLPESDGDAAGLLALALTSSLLFSGVVALAVLGWSDQIALVFGIPEFRPYFWLLPLGVWAGSSYAAFQYWATRKKNFARIARTRMVQALGGAGIQIGAGLVAIGPFGLLTGHIFNNGAGLIGLGRAAVKEDRRALESVTWRSMRAMLRQYARFPKYSALEALVNTAGLHAPTLIIAAMAAGPEAGYLMLATRVMTAPMGLIGGAVGQVYLANAPGELRSEQLREFTLKILDGLIFAGIVAAPAFSLAFGKEWARAGELVSWMTPWFLLQFLSSPVSMVMHVTARQRAMLVLTLLGGTARIASVACAGMYFNHILPEVFAVASGLVYFAYLLVFSRAAGVTGNDLCAMGLKNIPTVICWVVAGIVATLLLSRAWV